MIHTGRLKFACFIEFEPCSKNIMDLNMTLKKLNKTVVIFLEGGIKLDSLFYSDSIEIHSFYKLIK